MLRKVSFGLAGLAMLGLAGPAMAGQVNNQTYEVFVNINVHEEVSLWANDEFVTLDMQGNDGNNSAYFESSISHINNIAADISANVEGNTPLPIVPGGGVYFYIFNNINGPTAVGPGSMLLPGGNAYGPPGAVVWSPAEINTAGGITKPFTSVGIATTFDTIPVTYVSASPGELPLPGNFTATVTWTIAPDT